MWSARLERSWANTGAKLTRVSESKTKEFGVDASAYYGQHKTLGRFNGGIFSIRHHCDRLRSLMK
jgi:hypothetical protein